MIDYQRINIKNLSDYIKSTAYSQGAVIPISEHRAESYLKNPRAEGEDVVLYLAYDKKELVGYRLILPDELHLKEEKLKIGWFSCLYVHEKYRGKGIAKMLTAMAVEDWNDQIIYHDPVSASGNLYLGSGQFVPWQKTEGLRCFLGINLHHILTSRRLNYLPNYPFKLLDKMVNQLLFLRLPNFKRNKGDWAAVDKIEGELTEFIDGNVRDEFIQRGAEELNWIVNYPWILESDTNPIADRYYFSAYEKAFGYYMFSLRDEEKQVKAFMMLLVKNKQMKLLYLHCSEELVEDVYQKIIATMKQHQIQTFTCYDSRLVDYLKSRKSAFFLKRNKIKPLFVSKKLVSSMKRANYKFQDGEGDNSFT